MSLKCVHRYVQPFRLFSSPQEETLGSSFLMLILCNMPQCLSRRGLSDYSVSVCAFPRALSPLPPYHMHQITYSSMSSVFPCVYFNYFSQNVSFLETGFLSNGV